MIGPSLSKLFLHNYKSTAEELMLENKFNFYILNKCY